MQWFCALPFKKNYKIEMTFIQHFVVYDRVTDPFGAFFCGIYASDLVRTGSNFAES